MGQFLDLFGSILVCRHGLLLVSSSCSWYKERIKLNNLLNKLILVPLFEEVNLFWAAHQTHHSSEDYYLTTALRQSIFQGYTSWVNIRLLILNFQSLFFSYFLFLVFLLAISIFLSTIYFHGT